MAAAPQTMAATPQLLGRTNTLSLAANAAYQAETRKPRETTISIFSILFVMLTWKVLFRHKDLEYEIDYDFAPNDGTPPIVVTEVNGRKLDGSIHITSITLNGKSRPVTAEVLAMMEDAAALEELALQDQWHQHLCSLRESRLGRISIIRSSD